MTAAVIGGSCRVPSVRGMEPTSLILALVLLAGNPPMPPAAQFSARVDNPWFPLPVGSRAVYQGVKDGKAARDVVTVSRQTATIGGIPCAVVEDRLYLDGRLEERTTDWYSQDAGGTVWYLGERTAELDRQGHVTSTAGSWQHGVDGAQAGVFMPAHPERGQTYQQEFLKGQAEDHFRVVAVLGGSVLLTEEWTPLEPGVLDHKWYARGLGDVVEQTVKGGDERLELVSTSP
jgi:hypothetical protein